MIRTIICGFVLLVTLARPVHSQDLDKVRSLLQQALTELEGSDIPPTDPPPTDPPPTGDRTLITAEWLRSQYVGKFGLAVVSKSPFNFNGSRGFQSKLPNDQFICSGHTRTTSLHVMQIPPTAAIRTVDPLAIAQPVGEWIDLEVPLGLDTNYGVFADPNSTNLFVAMGEYYAVTGDDLPSQCLYDRTGNLIGGPHTISLHHNAAKGYVSAAPSTFPGALYVVGNSGSAGSSKTSWGPALAIVNPDYTSRTLLYYTHKTGLDAGGLPWNNSSSCHGIVWVETATHHGVLCFGCQGVEPIWYGQPTTVIDGITYTDPVSPYKGYHASDFQRMLWIYNPADLLKYDPEKPEEPPQPIETVKINDWFTVNPQNQSPKVSFSGGRLIIAEPKGYQASRYSRTPMMHVYDLTP